MLVDLRKVVFALEVCQRKAQSLGFDDMDVGDNRTLGGMIQDALNEVNKFETDEVEASHSSEDFEEADEPQSYAVADDEEQWKPDDPDWEPGQYDTGGES